MSEQNRATTLRLRTRLQAPVPGDQLAPRPNTVVPVRGHGEARRLQVHTITPRRTDPTSQAILAELAALGLADETDTGE